MIVIKETDLGNPCGADKPVCATGSTCDSGGSDVCGKYQLFYINYSKKKPRNALDFHKIRERTPALTVTAWCAACAALECVTEH
jgi:hypothetical protein